MAKGLYKEWIQGDNLIKLQDWVRNGATDVQLCERIGITKKTLYEWKNKYSEFSDALKKVKEVVDAEVENALHNKALGYTVTLKKSFKCKKIWYDSEGRRCEEEILKPGYEEQYVPPDTLAQIFWLKNRRPNEWREKQEEVPDESVTMLLTNVCNAMMNIRKRNNENEEQEG